MADWKKEFLRGGATVKEFDWGNVVNVFLHRDQLVEDIKSGKLKLSDAGSLSFSVLKKKPEKIKPGEATHYLVQSQREDDGPQQAKALQSTDTDDDLPF